MNYIKSQHTIYVCSNTTDVRNKTYTTSQKEIGIIGKI